MKLGPLRPGSTLLECRHRSAPATLALCLLPSLSSACQTAKLCCEQHQPMQQLTTCFSYGTPSSLRQPLLVQWDSSWLALDSGFIACIALCSPHSLILARTKTGEQGSPSNALRPAEACQDNQSLLHREWLRWKLLDHIRWWLRYMRILQLFSVRGWLPLIRKIRPFLAPAWATGCTASVPRLQLKWHGLP